MKAERLIPAGLVLVLALQGLAMAFFLFDAADELSHDPSGLHPLTEGLTAVALGAGILLVGRALLRSLHHARQHKSALAIASGEFRRVIEAEFDLWHLTPAERAVALLSLRGSALGTVRAQLAKIYAKSGTANRAQLSAVFVERLMGGPPPPP